MRVHPLHLFLLATHRDAACGSEIASATPKNNFAIAIDGEGHGGSLRISWDTFVWTAPFALK